MKTEAMLPSGEMKRATRLWDKGADLDREVHAFTVGDDPVLDVHLVRWDCLGSAAHARALRAAGVLDDAELAVLLDGLKEIASLAVRGQFHISPELEDVHTAIEAHLTRRCGALGGKIHAGRSRNDQVATAMRLWMRDEALRWIPPLLDLIETLALRIERDGAAPMPGYTHMQAAMPSSFGQWLHAMAEALLEQARACLDLLDRLDACPLGAAAGFGAPLALDRRMTATLLGFTRVQRSPIDVQNSRGRMEKYFARVAADVGAALGRLGGDVVLFASSEFGFFELPHELTTGSSIMPQKRNPDVAELLRAGGARLAARVFEIDAISGKLPSGYHRDLQLTKEPAMRCASELRGMFPVALRLVTGLTLREQRAREALRPEVYATHAAMDRVRRGQPFREAYREVARALEEGAEAALVPPGGRVDSARVADADVAAMRQDAAEVEALALAIRRRESAAEASLLPKLAPYGHSEGGLAGQE